MKFFVEIKPFEVKAPTKDLLLKEIVNRLPKQLNVLMTDNYQGVLSSGSDENRMLYLFNAEKTKRKTKKIKEIGTKIWNSREVKVWETKILRKTEWTAKVYIVSQKMLDEMGITIFQFPRFFHIQ